MKDEPVKSTCLSPLLSVDLVAQSPVADIFSFLAGVLTPLLDPSRGPWQRHHVIYCPESSVSTESTQHGWLNKGATCCSLAHKHTSMVAAQARTQSHDSPRGVGGWLVGWLARDVYHSTITTHGRIESNGCRDKQKQTSITPATNLPVLQNS